MAGKFVEGVLDQRKVGVGWRCCLEEDEREFCDALTKTSEGESEPSLYA